MDRKINVVMLCGNGQSSRIMYNAIVPQVNIQCVILENKPSGKTILQRRIKKIGFLKVLGQVAFLFVNKFIAQASKTRIKQILSGYDLSADSIPVDIIRYVDTINSEETIKLLKKYNPDAVVVNGTRIISKQVLSSVDVPFINTHMGITPKYRGVHGGYWALAKGDVDNCGVTVHIVDEGVDTGGVLYQASVKTDESDNFNTYPIHQIAKAIPLMLAALNDVKEKRTSVKQGVYPSGLWYHPTIVEYLRYWVQRGVK
ncbi:MAG: formyl transferase [Candidatus Thiodiazotropha sp.]|jgi:folate-dependent phosphoribosylglycinamide formyltransferase PurN